jgi:hypothetical protein
MEIDALWYPMLRNSDTDATFAPYSNICPISGRTESTVERTSTNRLNASDPDYINANFDGDGNQITGNNRIATGYIEVTPSSMLKFKSSSAVAFVEFVFYTANKTFDSVEYANNASELVKTVPATAKYVRLGEQITGMGTLTPAIFTTLNQTLSDNYRTVTVVFEDEHGDPVTVYGGSVDFTTGVATVTDGIIDMGNMGWTYSSANTRFQANMPLDYKIPASSSERITGLMCSCYEPNISPITGSRINGTISGYEGSLSIYVNDYSYTDVTQFKTARTGQKILYRLATPTTLQLTPTQLQMLKGYNRVTIESGSIEIGYIAKLT